MKTTTDTGGTPADNLLREIIGLVNKFNDASKTPALTLSKAHTKQPELAALWDSLGKVKRAVVPMTDRSRYSDIVLAVKNFPDKTYREIADHLGYSVAQVRGIAWYYVKRVEQLDCIEPPPASEYPAPRPQPAIQEPATTEQASPDKSPIEKAWALSRNPYQGWPGRGRLEQARWDRFMSTLFHLDHAVRYGASVLIPFWFHISTLSALSGWAYWKCIYMV